MPANGRRVVIAPDPEIPVEVLARSVRDIAEGMRKILDGRLNSNAIVLLVSEASGVGRKDVKAVLDATAALGERYLKKAKTP